MIVVGLDVDDVTLSLIPNWLSLYNSEFNDNLTPEDITDWDISKFVKPEAKQKIYQYIAEPEVFRTAKPVEGALQSVQYLKSKGFRVIYVSASNPDGSKEAWLKEHGFLEDKKDFVQAYDKGLIHCDFLVDDKCENVVDARGLGILFTRPWNQFKNWAFRANNWKDALDIIDRHTHTHTTFSWNGLG